MSNSPILWSFRRCPYAIRARLALQAAGVRVELREIVLRNKPLAFLETSPTATVPALRLQDVVLDESLDIMIWALEQNDPKGFLDMPDEGWNFIEANDGPFKRALDHTKYSVRFPNLNSEEERRKAAFFLHQWNERLADQEFLFGPDPKICDYAILPFVRQFANTDIEWFRTQNWPHLASWLDRFLESDAFQSVMTKYDAWTPGSPQTWFGAE